MPPKQTTYQIVIGKAERSGFPSDGAEWQVHLFTKTKTGKRLSQIGTIQSTMRQETRAGGRWTVEGYDVHLDEFEDNPMTVSSFEVTVPGRRKVKTRTYATAQAAFLAAKESIYATFNGYLKDRGGVH